TARPGPGKVGWLLVYPDAYEIGLPNQGLQILYEILNERTDAVPYPLEERPEAAGRADRLTNTAGGLAASLRLAGTGTMEPLWDRLAGLTMPVLVVAGELDEA